MTGASRPDAEDVALEHLGEFEARLDPSRVEQQPGVDVLGYGEVSVALRLAELPGSVAKRMAGFVDADAAARYARLVDAYVQLLTAAGIRVVDTSALVVPRRGRPPVVYLLQPAMAPGRLGQALVHDPNPLVLDEAIAAVLEQIVRLRRFDALRGGARVAVDAQLSNWWFPPPSEAAHAQPDGPVLLDVGTPILTDEGDRIDRRGRAVRRRTHRFEQEWILRSGPVGVRTAFRLAGTVPGYLDDYLEPRTAALDLLGNLVKEGRPDRVARGVRVVNAWIGEHADLMPVGEPVTVAEVQRYYRSDAALMALYLRLRRADRAAHRLLGRPYDFVLPGPISR